MRILRVMAAGAAMAVGGGSASAQEPATTPAVAAAADADAARKSANAAAQSANTSAQSAQRATDEANRASAGAGTATEAARAAGRAAYETQARLARFEAGPPNTETVAVSAKTLSSDFYKKAGGPVFTLSEHVDGCLWPTQGASEPSKAFACVTRATRAAARTYRRLGGDRQRAADRFTAGAAAGLTVAAMGIDHAATDTIRAWSIAGLIPVVADDLTQPGPRARLHNVAATAMTVMTVRMEALAEAHAQLATVEPSPGGLAADVQTLCSPQELAKLDTEAKALSTQRDEALKLNGVIEARCAELRSGIHRLQASNRAWSMRSGPAGASLARGLGADAVVFDDTIARLDRILRAAAPDVVKAVFKVPFNMAAKIVNGQLTPPEFTGRALEVFTGTYTFHLTRLPEAAIPDPLAATLRAPPTLGGRWSGVMDSLNQWTERLNVAIAAAQVVKSINNQSILTVRPGSTDQPVTLTAPTPP